MNDQTEIERRLRARAEKWRKTEGKRWLEGGAHLVGFVKIFRGKVVGWMRELQPAKEFEPCVFAVPSGKEKIFVTMDGDAANGAGRWCEMS